MARSNFRSDEFQFSRTPQPDNGGKWSISDALDLGLTHLVSNVFRHEKSIAPTPRALSQLGPVLRFTHTFCPITRNLSKPRPNDGYPSARHPKPHATQPLALPFPTLYFLLPIPYHGRGKKKSPFLRLRGLFGPGLVAGPFKVTNTKFRAIPTIRRVCRAILHGKFSGGCTGSPVVVLTDRYQTHVFRRRKHGAFTWTP